MAGSNPSAVYLALCFLHLVGVLETKSSCRMLQGAPVGLLQIPDKAQDVLPSIKSAQGTSWTETSPWVVERITPRPNMQEASGTPASSVAFAPHHSSARSSLFGSGGRHRCSPISTFSSSGTHGWTTFHSCGHKKGFWSPGCEQK